MSDTVKIRYIGPLTEGLWTAAGEHGAHEFEHGEFVDVPVALAVELMAQREPAGDPEWDTTATPHRWVTRLDPVWELADGDSLPDPTPVDEPEEAAKPARPRTRARTGSKR